MRVLPRLTALAIAIVVSVSVGPVSLAQESAKVFGSPITLSSPVSLTKAITDYKANLNKDVLLKGDVRQVCEAKGCWLVLADSGKEVRVTFKDYGFFVPKQIKGKKVLAQGRLTEREETVEYQRHMLKDGGASESELALVKAPRKVHTFVASGVSLQP